MFCFNCGEQISDKAVFCPFCGVQTGHTLFINSNSNQIKKTSGFAVAGFVLSLLGFLLVLLALLGLIFSSIGCASARRNPNVGGIGLAIAGIVISSLYILALLFLIFIILVASAAA